MPPRHLLMDHLLIVASQVAKSETGMIFLSPPGDLEMDLSGDIPIQSIRRHIGLSVQNCAKLFNSDQTR